MEVPPAERGGVSRSSRTVAAPRGVTGVSSPAASARMRSGHSGGYHWPFWEDDMRGWYGAPLRCSRADSSPGALPASPSSVRGFSSGTERPSPGAVLPSGDGASLGDEDLIRVRTGQVPRASWARTRRIPGGYQAHAGHEPGRCRTHAGHEPSGYQTRAGREPSAPPRPPVPLVQPFGRPSGHPVAARSASPACRPVRCLPAMRSVRDRFRLFRPPPCRTARAGVPVAHLRRRRSGRRDIR